MLAWIDSVKNRTRFSEIQLMTIWSSKFLDGDSHREISRNVRTASINIDRLFYSESKIQEIKNKKKEYQKLNKSRIIKSKRIYDNTPERKEKRKIYRNTKPGIKMIKKSYTKHRIKSLIKNEVIKTPITNLKMAWDGIGFWAKKYNECVECHLNLFKHQGLGMCMKCYESFRNSTRDKEKNKVNCREYYKKNSKKLLEQQKSTRSLANRIFDQIKNNEIEITPKLENLVSNHEKINA